MIDIILHSALFGLTLTFGVYIVMSAVNQRTGSPLLNPVLLTILTIVGCWCSISRSRTTWAEPTSSP